MTRLGIIGSDGRMGQTVEKLAAGTFDIRARVSADSPDFAALSECDVVIDFSRPDALMTALDHLGDDTRLVSGTTGLTADQDMKVAAAATRRPVLRSGNFSVGVNLLVSLARQSAKTLGPDWDIEILEMHHRDKADAPSGTALMLGQAAALGRGVALKDVMALERDGTRMSGDIGYAVLRGGGVFGDHEVRLTNGSQMLTLGHRALNRDVFGEGAISAAQWLMDQPAGLYGMSDLLPL